MIAQYGGITAAQAFDVLCLGRPFASVSKSIFADVLRSMARAEMELLEQAPDGTLLLGRNGKRIVGSFKFYRVFMTPEEYRVLSDGKELGSLAILFVLTPSMTIIFSGRCWRVRAVDDAAKVIQIERSTAGNPPRFGGQVGDHHDRLMAEMRTVLSNDDTPPFLDATAMGLLNEGRREFR